MIVVDLETSGVHLAKSGIWQIGAIDFDNPKRQFFQEARIDDEDILFEKGKVKLFQIIGKTEEQLRDKTKQSQKQMLQNFFKWCEKSKIKNFMCEGPQFDVAFLEIRALKYGLKFPFHYRAFDLHSIAQTKMLQIEGKFSIEKDHSSGLRKIFPFCGIQDERGFHNALEDAKLTAECFSRIWKGKNFLEEYEKFPVPEYLKIRGNRNSPS
jgi:DNA polymerase III subunit epsilon